VDIATDAYIYGYSLITTAVTRMQMTHTDKVEGLRGPVGQFINVKRYPPGDYRGASAPNADTLYSAAWVDLSEPQVFSHPDMGKCYFLFPMVDLWMPIIQSPGSRTTGGKAGNFLLTGPGWKGEVPEGMTHYEFGSRYMLILGRTYANGSDADYRAVNALQAQYTITPLSAWGKPYTPKAPPVDANPGISMTDKPQAVIKPVQYPFSPALRSVCPSPAARCSTSLKPLDRTHRSIDIRGARLLTSPIDRRGSQ
jgi:hypothetical protein